MNQTEDFLSYQRGKKRIERNAEKEKKKKKKRKEKKRKEKEKKKKRKDSLAKNVRQNESDSKLL